MNMKNQACRGGSTPPKTGFTLIEMLAVIAIIAILAAILIPVVGGALQTAKKRRALAEMNSIKVAVMQFRADLNYMPWPSVKINKRDVWIGDDMWAVDNATQLPVMELLTGSNSLKKIYLQVPEKSRPAPADMTFLDPWKQPYVIGLDRNLDGMVVVANTGEPAWDGKSVMEKVLVFCPGPPGENKPMKTFDIAP